MPTRRRAHDEPLPGLHDDEGVGGAGAFVKSMVFGALDGLLTSFAIIAGASGKYARMRASRSNPRALCVENGSESLSAAPQVGT